MNGSYSLRRLDPAALAVMVVMTMLVGLAFPSVAQAVGTVEVRPVRASGVQGVDWQFGPRPREITLVGAGLDVVFDVFISDWSSEILDRHQVGFTCSHFTLLAGQLAADGVKACSEAGATPGFCWEIDITRTDYIYFEALPALTACQGASVCPGTGRVCGSQPIVESGVADPGVPRYAMTIVYRAVDAGIGVATAFIDPIVTQTTLISSEGVTIGPDTFLGALVTFGPLPPAPICGDNVVNQPSEQCDGTDAAACPGQCLPGCTCPAGGGSCSPDADNDGIQDDVDEFAFSSNGFLDESTTPDTRGSFSTRGDQDLCASDSPSMDDGVRIVSLGETGSAHAVVSLRCFDLSTGGSDMDGKNLRAAGCLTATCRPGPVAELLNCSASSATAQAVAPGDIDVDLRANGVVVGTLVLPPSNTVRFDPQTLEITAPTSNNTTLIVITPTQDQLPVGPGETVSVPPVSIPAVSTWGLVGLALALLVGSKVYFRRKAIEA